ncbi:MAG: hypothetical protein RLZZ546_1219, partial [Bacteroidota bacterium]
IIKSDKLTDGDSVAWILDNTYFSFHYPKRSEITLNQKNYIEQYFRLFNSKIYNNNVNNGFPSLIEIRSFIDYMLINELSANVDAYQLSTYYHKDRGGKLRAGPIWDFNLTYGNDLKFWGLDRSHYDVWQFANGDNEGPRYWKNLFADYQFRCHLSKRWKYLTREKGEMNLMTLNKLVDDTYKNIEEACDRDRQKWQTFTNFIQQKDEIKNWLTQRVKWMDDQLSETSGCPFSAPNIVISAINYNPAGQITANEEFIEITNNDNNIIDLTGFYFRNLGINFQFPDQSKIFPGQKLYVVGNKAVFESKYGKTAFGVFNRDLPNDDFDLILANGWGEEIDRVEYKDKAPWPSEADGKGAFLVLKNLNADNNLGENWKTDVLLSTEILSFPSVILKPNPSSHLIFLESEQQIELIMLYDEQGKLANKYVFPTHFIDITDMSIGLYYAEIVLIDGSKTFKRVMIIK